MKYFKYIDIKLWHFGVRMTLWNRFLDAKQLSALKTTLLEYLDGTKTRFSINLAFKRDWHLISLTLPSKANAIHEKMSFRCIILKRDPLKSIFHFRTSFIRLSSNHTSYLKFLQVMLNVLFGRIVKHWHALNLTSIIFNVSKGSGLIQKFVISWLYKICFLHSLQNI